ncbi:hypothetical protein KF913_18435 [Candidatus Obscuribacterales bacterium]|nr:hypothetical protein [Candidatus Obscuribacterales bacterium]
MRQAKPSYRSRDTSNLPERSSTKLPNGAWTRLSHHSSIRPSIKLNAGFVGRISQKFDGFRAVHLANVINVLVALSAVSDPLVTSHRTPENWTFETQLDVV